MHMIHNFTHKKIGIWGYGITGKAAVDYLHNNNIKIAVLDKKELSPADRTFLNERHIAHYTQEQLNDFLQQCDYILPSPGIDLRPYQPYQSKWINELDMFSAAWHKPIIAITGSVGKTTVTHLLSSLLTKAGKHVATGGNIGTPMFDLLMQQSKSDLALLEVSSFQLEYTKRFAPTLALWTNFYPNHLDRHGSEQEYKHAKAKLMAFQHSSHNALVPLALKDFVNTQSTMHYFANHKPSDELFVSMPKDSSLYYFDDTYITCFKNGMHIPRIKRNELPALSYEENWLIIFAALDLLNVPLSHVTAHDLILPEHRLEHVATVNGIDFYNDSKSTTPQSTLAAVNRLHKRPVLLLLGGMSKGVDRAPLIKELRGNVKKIYCFGKEADQLKALCDANNITAESHATLDSAFDACIRDGKREDQILLSPAGASFDLFTNYMERGAYFKKLVNDLTHKQ